MVTQFNHWFIYFLIAFVAVTLSTCLIIFVYLSFRYNSRDPVTEVYYLNIALALFNTGE
jgi:hypothetical protein